ncbi:MAG: short-chain dehydrogenase [Deltaproteobacteria bacterium]|nr:short-chain dehydrogenase [Deltaproteobacteria bacterium]
MSGRVAGKVAIVTGSAAGIGRATVELLAAEGARVVVADVNAEGAEAVAKGIRERGGSAIAQRTDVSLEEDIADLVAAAVREFGGLQILHNNAAITAAAEHVHDTDLISMSLEFWDRSFSVNLRGAMLGCKHALPVMIEGGGGAIVNTSSNLSLAGDFSQFAYSAAKAGVNSLTRSVATAYGRQGIRCNTVSPGFIRTASSGDSVSEEMSAVLVSHNLIARVGEPNDLAQAVLYLASDEAAFVTGQLISVDGGQLAHLPHYAYLNESGTVTTGAASDVVAGMEDAGRAGDAEA